MKKQFRSGTIAAGMLVTLAGFAVNANAQVRLWNAPASGAWNVAANWNAADVPDSFAEAASITLAGPFTVTLPSGYSTVCGALTISHPLVTLSRLDNGSLTCTGISNNGLIQIGSAGGNGTVLRAVGNQVISGSGVVRLQASGNLDTGFMQWASNTVNDYFTQNVGHTIAGTGNIYARLDNAGLVDADAAGATLQLFNQNKNNSGTMRASAGALLISGISVTQTGAGRIESTGGSVNMVGSAIVGGVVANLGGTINASGGSTTWSGVTKTGTMNVLDTCSLLVTGGSLNNSGDILVNSGVGGNAAALRASSGAQTLSGPGAVVLRATTNLDTAIIQWASNSVTESFAQSNGHTIRGTGNIYINLVNSGLVNADQNTRVLRLLSQPKSNNATGVMRASGGGTLDINGVTVTSAGVFEALTGSVVQLTNGAITGGTLNAAGSGLFRATGASVITNLTNHAPVMIPDGSNLYGTGAIVNTAVITVNETAGGNGTSFRPLAGNLTLNGSGSLTLTASPNLDTATITWASNPGSDTLTQSPSHTIRGTGNIYAAIINNGLVNADVSGRTLQLLSQPKTNNATFRASNGGTMLISGITVFNSSVIEAQTGSVVQVNSSTIAGGTLSTTGTGIIRATGTSVLNDLTSNASVMIADGNDLRTTGTLVNNAVITMNETSGGNGTYFRPQGGNVNLNGTGSVAMNASSNLETAAIYWTSNPGSETFTQGASHTIRGTGNIYAAIINNGLVTADVAGRTLQLLSQPKTNNATFRASNGGTMLISGITVFNTAVIEAQAGSVVQLASSSITGGNLSTTGTGIIRATGVSVLNDLTSNASVMVASGNDLRGVGTIVNNSVITLNEAAGGSGTYFRPQGGNLTLSGTGSLLLNATSNLETAAVYWTSNPGSETLTNAATHTLSGNGNIYAGLINNGIISPGVTADAAGRLHFGSQAATLTASSRFACNINGTAAAQFDRLTGTASIGLNGTLSVSFGYLPNIDDQFDVIAAPYTGRFTRLELPKGYYIEYLPSIVRVVFSGCRGDWDQDGDVDSDDITLFFGDFENGEADFDQDDDTDSDDIIGFFAAFESGC